MSQLAIVPPSAQRGISLRANRSDESWIVDQLTILAEARQAAVSAATLELFSSELAQFEVEDIAAGIRTLSLTRRRDGETAFPDLATIVEAVTVKKVRRLREENDRHARDE